LERLRVENFRRFQLVDLELPDGVTALVGRNGSGKSTLLEAIGWCLYGTSRTEKELIKRRGAASSEDVRVVVEFRFAGHAYTVTRELLGKQQAHVASVVADGKPIVAPGAASGKEAAAYVARLFHMDERGFFTSLVARQRELAALTDAKPADRKRIVIGLLRLDAVDGAIAEARQQKRDLRKQLDGLRGAMLPVGPMKVQMADLDALLVLDRQRMAETDAAVAALVDTVEDVRARRETSRKRADAHKQLSFAVAAADERVVHLRRERARRDAELARALAAADEAGSLSPRLATLPAAQERALRLAALAERHLELARVRAEVQKAEADAAKAAQERDAAQAALASASAVRSLNERLQKQRPLVEAQSREWQTRVAELRTREAEIVRQSEDLAIKEARIRQMGAESPCPTCTRPLREHHDALLHGFSLERGGREAGLVELRPKLVEARVQEAAVANSLRELAERETELREKLARISREEERLANAHARHAEAQQRAERQRERERALVAEPYDPAAHEAARGELRELEAVSRKHQRLMAEAERADEVRRILAEMAEAENAALAARAEADRQRALVGFEPAAHEALEQSAGAAEAGLTEARVARERLAGEHKSRLAERARVEAELTRQRALAQQGEALAQRVTLLEQLAGDRDVGLLPEFKDHLIGRVRPILSMHAGRLFRELTDARYADLEVDEEYDLLVHDDGEAFALERFSGGEGDLANLCLRLAVSQVVAERASTEGFGFLALDEVFGSQDEERKANILRALQTLSGRFRQILLITHITDVKDSVEHVLRVNALDDGTSTITVDA
jgi:exonuclease SbcC